MISQSKEFLINMRKKDIPPWIDGLEFHEQSSEVQDFYNRETDKIMDGLTINGVFIHPWLYYHTNVWKMMIDGPAGDRIPSHSILRDSEYFAAQCLQRAKERGLGLFIYGTRRFAKTSLISSYLDWRIKTTYNGTHTVVGLSDKDLAEIATYLEFGQDNVHPYFHINRIGADWTKQVLFGSRETSGKREVHATVRILNANMGRAGGNLVTAGGTPLTFIMDEVNKGPFLDTLSSALPSFYMSEGRGLRDTPILVGTSEGKSGMNRDVEDFMNNLEDYRFLAECWDILNDIVPEQHRTWSDNERKWGMFPPGQMSNEYKIPIHTNLADFLGKPKDKDLKKIYIQATDWAKSNEKINKRLEELEAKGNKKLYTVEKVSYPTKPKDCFIHVVNNDFPTDEMMEHLANLKERGLVCDLVMPYRSDSIDAYNGVAFAKDDKRQVAPYPFRGGIADAPVKIFEYPKRGTSYKDFEYVAGLDAYKTNVSQGTSLGTFIIIKRNLTINDPFAGKIVASYSARPSSSTAFCEVIEMLQDAYGARCLMESLDRMYELFLEPKGRVYSLLEYGEVTVTKNIYTGAKQSLKVGLTPTLAHQRDYAREIRDNLWREHEIDGLKLRGCHLIDDVELLEELIDWDGTGNYDRYVAFGHALLLMNYYDSLGYKPRSIAEKEYTKEQQAMIRNLQYEDNFGYQDWDTF